MVLTPGMDLAEADQAGGDRPGIPVAISAPVAVRRTCPANASTLAFTGMDELGTPHDLFETAQRILGAEALTAIQDLRG